jgi:FkbM family methyltransferase
MRTFPRIIAPDLTPDIMPGFRSTPAAIVRRLRQEKNLGRFLAARFLWRTGLSRYFEIDNGKFQLTFFPTALSTALWYDGDAWKSDESFIYDYVREGDTVIDAGANIGYLALAAGWKAGRTGHVLAIEAHPTTFGYLRQNVARNGFSWIDARNVALGESAGVLVFSDKRLDDQNEVLAEGGTGRSVAVRPLDEIATGFGHVDLLKIDVEGYEKFVLQGARNTLRVTDCVYFETWDRHAEKYAYRTTELIDFLIDAGFSVFRMRGRDLLPVATGFTAPTPENLIAVKSLPAFLDRCQSFRAA